ncbi:SlyX family protein [Bdellovibrio sp. HCB2-146]|uniref:SlyX family protein n=1 Tax=Bdellovibrio sp. HCB2-146 TaxID=3394362 RepID=UPI0039BC6D35
MDSELEKRFVDVETKVTHQEFLVEQLNEIVYQQQIKIDQLEAALTKLAKRMAQMAAGEAEIGPANEKPPHY